MQIFKCQFNRKCSSLKIGGAKETSAVVAKFSVIIISVRKSIRIYIGRGKKFGYEKYLKAM